MKTIFAIACLLAAAQASYVAPVPQESYAAPQNTYEPPAPKPPAPAMTYDTPAPKPPAPAMTYDAPATKPPAHAMTYEAPAPKPATTYETPAKPVEAPCPDEIKTGHDSYAPKPAVKKDCDKKNIKPAAPYMPSKNTTHPGTNMTSTESGANGLGMSVLALVGVQAAALML